MEVFSASLLRCGEQLNVEIAFICLWNIIIIIIDINAYQYIHFVLICVECYITFACFLKI